MLNLKRIVLGHKYEAPVVAFIGAYGAAIGAAVSVVSAISQANQQKKAANYNAAMAQQQAVAAQQQAAAQADMQRRRANIQMGKMEANYAASGLSMEGSPMEIMEQSARDAQLDQMNIIYGGGLRATGYQNTAALETAAGKNAQTSGYLKAGSTLLSSASSWGGGSSGYGNAGVDAGNYGSVWNTELPESDLWRAG